MVCFEASAPARPNYSRKREHCYLNGDVSWVPHCEKRPLVGDAVGCYARKVSPTMANHWMCPFWFLSDGWNVDIVVPSLAGRKMPLVKFVPNDSYINRGSLSLMHLRRFLVRGVWCDYRSIEACVSWIDCGRSQVVSRLCCWIVDHCKINLVSLM